MDELMPGRFLKELRLVRRLVQIKQSPLINTVEKLQPPISLTYKDIQLYPNLSSCNIFDSISDRVVIYLV